MNERELLVKVIRRLFDGNNLKRLNREDTIGVLMRCGAFHDLGLDGVHALTELAKEIDGAEIRNTTRYKVQERGPAPTTGRAWGDVNGQATWLGDWIDTDIEGSEEYCHGYVDASETYTDRVLAYQTVPMDPK